MREHTSSAMSKMAFVPKWAISCQLPLVTNPCFPIRRLRVGSISWTTPTTTTPTTTTVATRTQAYCHTLSILRLLIMKKRTTIPIWTAFLCVKLLTMSTFIRPLWLGTKIWCPKWRNLKFLPRLGQYCLLFLMGGHNFLLTRLITMRNTRYCIHLISQQNETTQLWISTIKLTIKQSK